MPCHLRCPHQHRDRPARVRIADGVIDNILAPNATDQDLIRVQGAISTDCDNRLLLALDDHGTHRQVAENSIGFPARVVGTSGSQTTPSRDAIVTAAA